jgi:endonuclease/exonuclease/phosphatase family metal-dependent hydrolase
LSFRRLTEMAINMRPPGSLSMRLMTWNVNHRAKAKAIPPKMPKIIASLQPDLIVLTEYVHGESRRSFLAQLAAGGLRHWLTSRVALRGENHVLVASRTPIVHGGIEAPAIAPSVPSNALHVILPHEGIEIVGLRVPDYSKQRTIKRACWDWIVEMARAIKDRPSVVLGDFNTDPKYPPSSCGDCINAVVAIGWQLASPTDGGSYWSLKNGSPCRIDHAFVSSHFTVIDTKYVTEFEGQKFVGVGPKAISDHAILAIDVELRQAGTTQGRNADASQSP